MAADKLDFIRTEFTEAQSVLTAFCSDVSNFDKILAAADILSTAIKADKKILSCGNGGSMSDAMHFAEELSGRYRENRKALPALAISDAGHLSCVANDFGYDFVFSRAVEALGKKGDVLLAISTSGNSQNVLNAAVQAQKTGMKVIALTGKDGGKLGPLADVEIRAPKSNYADRVQEIHIKVIHILIGLIEKELFGEK